MTTSTEVSVIRMEGAVRMGEVVDRLRAQVEENLRRNHARLVIDMSGVTSLDSSGIGVLVRSLTLAKQKGGTVKLSALPHSAEQTLKTTGLLKLFEVYETETKAVDSFVGA